MESNINEDISHEIYEFVNAKIEEIINFIALKVDTHELRQFYLNGGICWFLSLIASSINNKNEREKFIDNISRDAKNTSNNLRLKFDYLIVPKSMRMN